jgi:hypothetical protein
MCRTPVTQEVVSAHGDTHTRSTKCVGTQLKAVWLMSSAQKGKHMATFCNKHGSMLAWCTVTYI